MATRLSCLDTACDVDRAGKQQQLLCKRGFAGIRVRYDGKSSSPRHLVTYRHKHTLCLLIRIIPAVLFLLIQVTSRDVLGLMYWLMDRFPANWHCMNASGMKMASGWRVEGDGRSP